MYIDKSNYFLPYVIIASVTTTFAIIWDFYMDWGLFRKNSKILFLRDNILYPVKYYYIAMPINVILRLTWLSILIDFKNDEIKNFCISLFEIYRRLQWCLFRIENENANNPDKYRDVLEIPDIIQYRA